MNQLNNFTADKKENELKLPNCKYREIDYFQKLFFPKKKIISKDYLSFFHMNIYPFTKN